MIGVLVGLLILSWFSGRSRGLLGGLVGALVLTGMASTAHSGELATVYSPLRLASAVLPVTAVAVLLAVVVPNATRVAAFGWAAGSLLAALAAPRTGQATYLLPLALHVIAAGAIVRLAMWRSADASRNATAEGGHHRRRWCRPTRTPDSRY